jgi:tetratricopeptide (TPR) repeat protein
MKRALTLTLLLAAAVVPHQVALAANGNSMPPSMPSASAAPKSPEEQARDAYNSGIDHKNKGLKLEEQALKQSAKDADKTLAKAKDEYGKALKDFKKATDLVPDVYQAYNGMGFAYRKTGDYAKALEMYDKALSLAPGFPDALEYRGEAYLALNRIDDAKQTYLALFGKDRNNADMLMSAMKAWIAKHQTDPAGIDQSVISSFDDWIKERTKVAQLTADMSLRNNQSIWK